VVKALNGSFAGHIDAQVRTCKAVNAGFLINFQPLICNLNTSFRTAILAGLPPIAFTTRTEIYIDNRFVACQGTVKIHLSTLARASNTDIFERSPITSGGVALKMGNGNEGIRISNGPCHKLFIEMSASTFKIDNYIVGS
jgi:hypothetical protein